MAAQYTAIFESGPYCLPRMRLAGLHFRARLSSYQQHTAGRAFRRDKRLLPYATGIYIKSGVVASEAAAIAYTIFRISFSMPPLAKRASCAFSTSVGIGGGRQGAIAALPFLYIFTFLVTPPVAIFIMMLFLVIDTTLCRG